MLRIYHCFSRHNRYLNKAKFFESKSSDAEATLLKWIYTMEPPSLAPIRWFFSMEFSFHGILKVLM